MDSQTTEAVSAQPGAVDQLENAVKHTHASENTRHHAIYANQVLGFSIEFIARIFSKTPKTIQNWINQWNADGTARRKARKRVFCKFNAEMRQWKCNYYMQKPLSFLDEAVNAFKDQWGISISLSSIAAILAESGFTRKVPTMKIRICLTLIRSSRDVLLM